MWGSWCLPSCSASGKRGTYNIRPRGTTWDHDFRLNCFLPELHPLGHDIQHQFYPYSSAQIHRQKKPLQASKTGEPGQMLVGCKNADTTTTSPSPDQSHPTTRPGYGTGSLDGLPHQSQKAKCCPGTPATESTGPLPRHRLQLWLNAQMGVDGAPGLPR
jgi:hypothetical protein